MPLGDSEAHGAKIMIVDDEPQIRRFLRASLTSHDDQVVEAEDGKSAIKTCTIEKPDLVILDLGLPDVDGLDVISSIREWSPVPVIVLSIRSDEADKVDALDRGANDYVTKPFGMGELMARIRAALRQSAGSDAGGDPVVRAGAVEIDLSKRQVLVNGSGNAQTASNPAAAIQALYEMRSCWPPSSICVARDLRWTGTFRRTKFVPRAFC